MKGLSDGNVLLRTGHGAGAGMSSALQPGKRLCPVLVAPASNTHTQTHLCVCVYMHPTDKAGILCTRESPHNTSRVLPPRKGLEQEWVSDLCSFSSQEDTFNQKQRCRAVVSARVLVQDSPAGLLPRPCTLPQPLPSGF